MDRWTRTATLEQPSARAVSADVELLEVPQHQDLALPGAEDGERAQDVRPDSPAAPGPLPGLRPPTRSSRTVVALDDVLEGRRLSRPLPVAVPGLVRGDLEEPVAEAPGGVVAGEGAEGPQERLLGDFPGVLGVAGQPLGQGRGGAAGTGLTSGSNASVRPARTMATSSFSVSFIRMVLPRPGENVKAGRGSGL
ncbi:MAG: hypothetical protein MZV64_13075 [Ignavibacteriales bacterium]|nr:hypothetical protein [Ignavibacteriales bacterium]